MTHQDAQSNIYRIANKYNRKLPEIGDTYKHFKGNIVTIVSIAIDTENLTPLVVYKHDNTIWARPLEMFLSEVDKEKYPNTSQIYRFEFEEIKDV